MKLIINNLKIFIFSLLFFTGGKCLHIQGQNTISDSASYYTQYIREARLLSKSDPNTSYQLLQNSYSYFKQQNDTSKVVTCLLEMSEVQNQKGKYSLSFDHLWEAQYLTQDIDNTNQKAMVQINLAKLYDSFSMNNQVRFHLAEAVKISKLIYLADDKKIDELIASYMNLAVIHRKSGNYDLALNYLDSCFVNDWVIENKSIEMPFWDAERGYILLKLGNYTEAEKYLSAADSNASPSVEYTPNINLYLGELKMKQNQPDDAIHYFNKSLHLIRDQKLRTDLESEVLNNLSDVYFSKGKTQKAYSYLSESKEVADSILQLKNQTNSELFKIKNTYLKSISQKNELLEQQKLVIRQNKVIQSRLSIILVLVLLLSIVVILVIRMRLKLRKTVSEKEANEFQSKVNEERNQVKLEAKSKELTSYALQLIDKDSAIDELLKIIKEESPTSHKTLNNKYRKGSKDLWDEFNLRFTEVNSAFYNRLTDKYPKLSVTEQKHCALIKLNFATKEMARILNIETHSVHMSRSRIRKKIGMERSESLEKYISNL